MSEQVMISRELLERHVKNIESHLAITLEGDIGKSTADIRAALSVSAQPAGEVHEAMDNQWITNGKGGA